MLDALDKYMPESIRYTRPEGGLFVWCTMPENADADAFVREATKNNIRVVPGATFNCDTEAPSKSFRLNFSTPSDEQIVEGIKSLGTIAEKFV